MVPTDLTEIRERVDALLLQSQDFLRTVQTVLAKEPLARDGYPWEPVEDAILGTDIDRAVAEKLGRSTVSVSNRRTKLGISRRKIA